MVEESGLHTLEGLHGLAIVVDIIVELLAGSLVGIYPGVLVLVGICPCVLMGMCFSVLQSLQECFLKLLRNYLSEHLRIASWTEVITAGVIGRQHWQSLHSSSGRHFSISG